MERYLASGLIKGIGPGYAEKLVEAFGAAFHPPGEDTLATIGDSADIVFHASATAAGISVHTEPKASTMPSSGRIFPA